MVDRKNFSRRRTNLGRIITSTSMRRRRGRGEGIFNRRTALGSVVTVVIKGTAIEREDHLVILNVSTHEVNSVQRQVADGLEKERGQQLNVAWVLKVLDKQMMLTLMATRMKRIPWM